MILGRAGPCHRVRSLAAVGASKPSAIVRPAVTEDATLSDFASASDDGDERAEAIETDESDGSDPRDRPGANDEDAAADEDTAIGDENATVDRPTSLSTYAWGEYSCARCEDETDRAWRDEGALVCPDCKTW